MNRLNKRAPTGQPGTHKCGALCADPPDRRQRAELALTWVPARRSDDRASSHRGGRDRILWFAGAAGASNSATWFSEGEGDPCGFGIVGPFGAARARRAAAGIAAAALLAAAVTASEPARAAPAPVVPVLHWTPCGAPFECATAQVPLDYAR